jgi:hypothetical protein
MTSDDITIPEAVEFFKSNGVQCFVIDSEDSFDHLPSFASLFPGSQVTKNDE